MKLTQLTDNSWIAKLDGNPVGTLFRRPEGFLWMNKKKRSHFASFEDFTAHYGAVEIEEDDATPNQETAMVHGFPIKHANIILVDGSNPPQYRRDCLHGKAVFSAGYWAVYSGSVWAGKFCPKSTTVIGKNDTVKGPYKSRLEMNAMLRKLNNDLRLSGVK